MARNFNNSDTDRVDLGNIFAYDRDVAWTAVCFCRFEDLTGDERGLITKWDAEGANLGRQFQLQTKKTAAHVFQILSGGGTFIPGGATITTDTWYLAGVTCDGSQTLRLFSLGMDGTVLDNAVSGTAAADATTNASEVELGGREDSGDNHDGDIAHAATFSTQWVLQDFKDYLRAPARTAARFAGSPVFYLPLIGVSPEPDFSPNTNTGTVTGTTVSNGPPIGPLFGYGTDRGLTVAAVGGANPHGPLGHPFHGPFAGPVN